MHRRAGRRLLGAAATGLAAVALGGAGTLGTATAAPGAGSHVYFVATTSASAVAVRLTQKPADSIITADLVNDSLGYTATAFDSSQGSEAQAASVYPGALVVQGPSLLCNEGVLPFACPVKPPAYPLLADAQYPQHPHATAGPAGSGTPTKGPLAVQAAHATADVSPTTATGDADTGSAGLLPGTAGTISVGAQSSHTTVSVTHGALQVRVVSHASDIEVGSLLHIGSVTGTIVQRLVPGHKPVDTPSVVVTDVTVAGQRATIGNDGLHVAGHNGGKLLRRLAAKDIEVKPVTVSRNDTRHGARSDVTGLILTSSVPVKGTPYIPNPVSSIPPFDQIPVTGVNANGTYLTTVQLGAAGSAAAVQKQADIGLGGVAPPVQPVHQPAAPSGGGAGAVPVGNSAPAPPAAGSAQPAQGSAPQVASRTPATHGFLDGFTLDLSHFYLVLALGSAALFVGWRARAFTRRKDWAGGERVERRQA